VKVGDRVRYTGGSRPDWHGIPATVTGISVFGDVNVKFDREWNDDGVRGINGLGIPPHHLEKLIVIDPKRPVQTTENPPRECRTIGVLERTEGVITLLLSVPRPAPEDGCAEIEIKLDGKTVDPRGLGCALTFRNEPKVESSFYAMDKLGPISNTRGRTILSSVFEDYSSATYALELVTIDGKPTEAKIHARP